MADFEFKLTFNTQADDLEEALEDFAQFCAEPANLENAECEVSDEASA